MRPNIKKRKRGVNFVTSLSTSQVIISILLSSPLVLITCLDLPLPNEGLQDVSKLLSTNENRNQTITTNQGNNKQTKYSREVTDLKLISDFRAVKLSWTYEHGEANVPVLFDVRYCEITSWNIEIKCRHKDLLVDKQIKDPSNNKNDNNDNNNSTVILKQQLRPLSLVTQLEAPKEFHYETQIYDLRALTNYTFQVRVLRFAHEQLPFTANLSSSPFSLDNQNKHPIAQQQQLLTNNRTGRGNQLLSRRLDYNNNNDDLNEQRLISRIETKPFAAEATKCLADVTEVVINTGKYFGGRISAEDSLDARCSLIGNKTSEQSSYTLRIDHKICNGKLVDGNRIETMVLVHENKDILTHNTARFLVLCNFKQKSFTLRASVSLPKVNGLLAPKVKPAVITLLPMKPTQNSNSNINTNDTITTTSDEQTKTVMLGSMPGIYRARATPANPAAAAATTTTLMPDATVKANPMLENNQKDLATNERANSNGNNRAADVVGRFDEVEMNTIEKILNGKLLLQLDKRQQQEVAGRRALALTRAGAKNSGGSDADVVGEKEKEKEKEQQRQSKELNGFHDEPRVLEQGDYSNRQALVGLEMQATGNKRNNNNASQTIIMNNAPSTMSSAVADESQLQLQLVNRNGNGISNYRILLPQPVQVQSRVLYVDRSSLSSKSSTKHQQQQQQHPDKQFALLAATSSYPPKQQQQQQHEEKTKTTASIIKSNLDGGEIHRSDESERLLRASIQPVLLDEPGASIINNNNASGSLASLSLLSSTTFQPTAHSMAEPSTFEGHADLSKSLKQLIAPEGRTLAASNSVPVPHPHPHPERINHHPTESGASFELTGLLDSQTGSITMTNNHRVAGDYLPLVSINTNSSHTPNSTSNPNLSPPANANTDVYFDNNFSIKYSAAKVSDYPILMDSDTSRQQQLNARQLRGRTGRINSIESLTTSRAEQLNGVPNANANASANVNGMNKLASSHSNQMRSASSRQEQQQQQQPVASSIDSGGRSSSINRMGEVVVVGDSMANNNGFSDLLANSSNEQVVKISRPSEVIVAANKNSTLNATTLSPVDDNLATESGQISDKPSSTTLAQNITSYLLRWSLKTLTNLAKKSLESVISKPDNSVNISSADLNESSQNSAFHHNSMLPSPNQMFDKQETRIQETEASDDEFYRDDESSSSGQQQQQQQQLSASYLAQMDRYKGKKFNSIMASEPTVALNTNTNDYNKIDKLQQEAFMSRLKGVYNNQHGATTINGTINSTPTTTTTTTTTSAKSEIESSAKASFRPNATVIRATGNPTPSLSSLIGKDELLDSGQQQMQTSTQQQTIKSQTQLTSNNGLSSAGKQQTKLNSQQVNLDANGQRNGPTQSSFARHHERPSNFSKSLDFNKQELVSIRSNETPQMTATATATIKTNKSNGGPNLKEKSSFQGREREREREREQLNLKDSLLAHQFKSDAIDNNFSFSNWLMYGFIMLVSIVTGILLVFWFVSFYCTSVTSHGHNLNGSHYNQHFHHHQQQQQLARTGKISQHVARSTVQFHDQFQPSSVITFDDNNNNNLNTNARNNINVYNDDSNDDINVNNNTNKTSISNVTLNRLGKRTVLTDRTMHYESSLSPSYKKYADYASNNHDHVTRMISDNSSDNFTSNILENERRFVEREIEKNGLPEATSAARLNQKPLLISNCGNSFNCRVGSGPSPHPSSSSQSTRSTSVGSSTMIIDENDCKNNELFFTEHVLMDGGTGFGESYA